MAQMPNYPTWFAAREHALLGPRFAELLTPQSDAPARGITVNTLRTSPARFDALADFALEPSLFCPAAFAVRAADFKPGRHPYHHAGVFYAQEPSASAPAALLDVRPGMRVLDLCAAPGGKSSQLAAALQGEGLLVANEFVASRAEILRQNLERMGVSNAVVLNESTARLAAALPAWFDRVLVDAPCSGEGMFRKESAAVPQHNEGLVAQCAALGCSILEDAAALLAPGGVLVYSTCTFSPQEDEGQVAAFLARHPEFSLQDLSQVGFGRPGEANRTGGTPLQAEYCRRIWPADGGEGHFMARLQKSTAAPASLAAAKPEKAAKPPKEWLAFAQTTFPALARAPVTLLKEMVLLPPAVALPGNRLHLLRAGVLAGSVQKGRFVPAHALLMAAGAQCPNREELTLSDPRTLAWLHGAEIEAVTAQNGWCAVLVDGFPLGGGKASGGRIKNHYPKALRLLG